MARLKPVESAVRAAFRDNLQFCCDHYRSISELCRKIGINRQQFNRYLAGEALPSRHNHKRISDFFGLEDDELWLPHPRFRAIFGRLRAEAQIPPELRSFSYFLKNMSGPGMQVLDEYRGYYFRYFYSFSGEGQIKRELVHWRFDPDGIMVSTTKQRYVGTALGQSGRRQFFTYRGVVGTVGDRLFSIGADRLGGRDMGMAMLYPTIQKLNRLEGIMMGIGPTAARRIVAGRVVLDFLGRNIDRRKALLQLGIFSPEDPAVPAPIRASIRNDISPTEGLLMARLSVTA